MEGSLEKLMEEPVAEPIAEPITEPVTEPVVYSTNKPFVRIITGPCTDEPDNPAIEFKYNSDHFQAHSINCIDRDEDVLVTAHTGSGKTRVAEYAIAHWIKKGKRVVYTSPIKALSNQKYKELQQKFEFDKETGLDITVGLMTGDNKIKPDASLVVMTTEILRNALYDLGDAKDKKESYFEDNFIDTIGCVVFDEVHYINDPDRGHVWEETIILLDPKIRLVMLSATIDKAEDFANWIGKTKDRVINLIPTTHRVVPLEHFIHIDGKMYKILNKDEQFYEKAYDESSKQYKIFVKNKKGTSNLSMINDLVGYLKEHNLLQAIFFSFSRTNCEKYAKMITTPLVSAEEISEISNLFDSYMHKYEDQYLHIPQYHTLKQLIMKGIAFHHSGLLPIMKEIIEILFQRGLIKVLFATETFAVGVNMPTRTIIFTELEKPTSDGRRLLTTAEYKQMAGRAGRRGIDTLGHVIILPLYDLPYKMDLKGIMLGKVPHIESKFYINYSFILKIIQSRSKNMEQFIGNSLFNKDNEQCIVYEKEQYRIIDEKIKELESKIDTNLLRKIDKIIKFKQLEEQYKEMGISFNKKQLKEKSSLMQQLNKDRKLKDSYEQYCEVESLKTEQKGRAEYLETVENYVDWETSKVAMFLRKYGYLTGSTLDRDSVTIKGIIAAQINECNPILLTEMIVKDIFADLKPEEIIAILSIFINDTKSDEPKTLNDIKCSKLVKERLQKVKNMADEFVNSEGEIGLQSYMFGYWDIFFDYVDVSYSWAKGKPIKDVLDMIDTYEGNFIRNILKINNMAHDLGCLYHIYGDFKIIPQLEKVEDLLVRDIVTVSSLYIS